MTILEMACKVSRRAEGLGAAGHVTHVRPSACVDLDVVVKFFLAGERALAAVDVALKRCERRVEALMARQVARRAEASAALGQWTHVRLLACVCLVVLVKRKLAIKAAAAARFLAYKWSVHGGRCLREDALVGTKCHGAAVLGQ